MSMKDSDVEFPLTPGHEIAGIVLEVGQSVNGFKEGDKCSYIPGQMKGLALHVECEKKISVILPVRWGYTKMEDTLKRLLYGVIDT